MSARFELHVINDVASWKYNGRTTCLNSHRSQTSASKALTARLRSHSQCASAYEIVEVQA